jgi:segregation and condensation protein A
MLSRSKRVEFLNSVEWKKIRIFINGMGRLVRSTRSVLSYGCYNPILMDINTTRYPTGNYKVSVPVFEGPLDLLLQLIEHSELDITLVSLATVTDQFLEYIHQINEVEADEISAFLVIAAKLIQIKSAALLPRQPIVDIESEDPGQSLIHQLQAYKQFKVISKWFLERENIGLRSYYRVAPPPRIEARLDLSGINLNDLVLSAVEILQQGREKPDLDSVLSSPKFTIREKIALIQNHLKKGEKSKFSEFLEHSSSNLEIIVVFLALLELIKRNHVNAYQESLFTEILIEPLVVFNGDDEIEIEFGD